MTFTLPGRAFDLERARARLAPEASRPAADQAVPSFGAQFRAAFDLGVMNNNPLHRQSIRRELVQEIAAATGRGLPQDRSPDMSETARVLTRDVAALRAFDPQFSEVPASLEEFEAEVRRRDKAYEDDRRLIEQEGDSTLARVGGYVAAEALNPVNWALLPFGAPMAQAGRYTLSAFARTVGVEAGLGAIAELPVISNQQARAEELGSPEPDAISQLAFAAGFSGVLGAGAFAVARGLDYLRVRRAAEDRAIAATPDPLAADTATARAEAEMAGEAPPRMAAAAPPPVGADAPPGWERIRNGIFRGESGGDYDALFGFSNRPGGAFAGIRLTDMTVDEALAFASPRGAYGQWVAARNRGVIATPMGAYQVVGTTLRAAKEGLGLRGDEVMTPALQERIAHWIYRTQGTGAWVGYRGPSDGFTPPPATARAFDTPATGPDRRMTLPDEVVGPGGTRVAVRYEVVDIGRLRFAEGDLQPRDRAGRAASAEQVQYLRANLDPAQLMPSVYADRGTPIVGPDGIIESGNGRVMALGQVFDTNPASAAAYRAAIERAGFAIPEGVERPVLVATRTSDLTPDARRGFVRELNTSAVARMSGAEQAATDAAALTPQALALWRAGRAIPHPDNVPFVRAMLGGLPQAERAPFYSAAGRLSPDGLTRIRAAFFARAFDAADLIRLRAETDHPAVTGILRMLEDIAPDWAAFRAMVASGQVRPEFDITDALLDTVRIIARARAEGREGQSVIGAIRDRLAQGGLFGGDDPMTEALIAAFYRGDRARSPDATGDILRRYAAEASILGRADQVDGLPSITPEDALEAAVRGHERREPMPVRAGDSASETTAVDPVPEIATTADAPAFDDGAQGADALRIADAIEEALVPPSRLTELDDDPVSAVRELVDRQPFDTLDELYDIAPAAQRALDAAGADISARLGVPFLTPGLKKRATTEAKVARKGYASVRQLTDVSRGGFVVTAPEQADAIVAELARTFDVIDEGWKRTPFGYIDRKALIVHPNGLMSEVQIWTEPMLAAKKTGHALYERARDLLPEDPERLRLEQDQVALYGAAAGDLNRVMSSGDGGVTSPKLLPKRDTRAPSSGNTAAVFATSSASTGVQPAPGARMDTAASAPSAERNSTAGRLSQSQSASSFMGSVPLSDTSNVGAPGAGRNAPASFAALDRAMEIRLTPDKDGPTVSVGALIDGTADDKRLIETLTGCRIGGAP